MRSLRRFFTVVFILIFAVLAEHVSAQATTGSVGGRVTDANGALIPHASVDLTAQETGVVKHLETDDAGSYLALDLPPAHYVISVHQAGFKPFVTKPFELQIDQKLRVDAALAVGEVTETVSVTDVVPLLQTQGAENGQVIGASEIENMPLLGRDFTDLMLLVPGVVHGEGGNNVNLSVNGQREFGNSIQLNGVETTGNRNNDTSLRPSVDAMQEFKVVTSDYAPEFGRASGGAILLETKGGSNQFHGTAYEFFRPNNTAAGSYDTTGSQVNLASQLKQHNFGGTIGGPIRKDKTFFFVSYEGQQLRNAYIYPLTVPTTDEVNFLPDGSADLSGLTDPYTGNQIPIFDPNFFLNNYYVQQFPGNIIPAGDISPGGKLILTEMFPKPNNANFFFNNYTAVQRVTSHGNTGNVRLDQVLSQRDRLSLTYDISQSETLTGDPYQGAIQQTNAGGADSGDHTWLENQSFGLTWSHTFSANLLNDLRGSYFITPLVQHSLVDGTQLASKLGIQNANITGFPDTYGFPQIQFETGAITGGSTYKPLAFRDENTQIADALTWIHGRHSFKFGYEYRFLNSHPDFSLFPVPYEYVGGSYAAMTSDSTYCYYTYEPCSNPYGFYDPNAYYGTGGSEIADLLLGLPYVVYQGLQLTNPHTTSNEHSFYLQDSWQVTDQLNLNYGVRYEYRQPYVDANNNASNFDIDTLSMQIAGRDGNSRSLVDSNKHDFAPRLGVAFAATPRTSIRAGYGMFFTPENDAREDILTKNYPFFTQDEYVNDPYYFAYTLDAGVPRSTTIDLPQGASSIDLTSVPGANTFTVYSEPDKFPTGYSEMFNLTVQQILPRNISVEVGYVGAMAHKLSYEVGNYNIRNYLSSAIGKVQTLEPIGQSNYNALQAKVERRYANGWSVLASYTYAHSLDNGPAPFDLKSSNMPQNPFDILAEYASSDADLRHNFVMSNQIDLPFGHGKRFFGSARGAADAIVGGWHLNSIASFHTGTPVNIVVNSGYADYPGLRPNLVPGQDPTLPRGKRNLQHWFNTAAFAIVSGQSNSNPIPGNAGRNLVRGPGYTNEDLSLFKNFTLPERLSLQFRAESFNVLNTPHYDNPNANFSQGNFGTITSVGGERIMQFALKLIY
ncbi:MAG TPA: TonB-dependent receptor [Terracidiphilus sp.]|nr:TonB-dependent receptor [Terracidiphilus sp.]